MLMPHNAHRTMLLISSENIEFCIEALFARMLNSFNFNQLIRIIQIAIQQFKCPTSPSATLVLVRTRTENSTGGINDSPTFPILTRSLTVEQKDISFQGTNQGFGE